MPKFRFFSYILAFIFTIVCERSFSSEISPSFGINLYYDNYHKSGIIITDSLEFMGNALLPYIEFDFGWIKFYNEVLITTDSLTAEKGSNKKVKGLYGFNNKAYVRLKGSYEKFAYSLLLGREYLQIGYSNLNKIFISNSSRPFDQVSGNFTYFNYEFGFSLIQLDNFNEYKRYLSVHYITYATESFRFTLGEAVLYAGVNRSFELNFLNPTLIWTGELISNSYGNPNGMVYGNIYYSLNNLIGIYSEIIIDDYQINRSTKSDLEPPEIGYLFGLSIEDLFKTKILFNAEYVKILNRTYQTPKNYEIFTHRGYSIGHYLGNDFDMFQIFFKLQISSLEIFFNNAFLRDGNNGLDTPFDTPWMDDEITLKTGYSEQFPTTPINYNHIVEIGIKKHLFNGKFYFVPSISYDRSELNGLTKEKYSLNVRAELNISKAF